MDNEQPKRRIITRSTYGSVVEELILNAKAEGKFDNLRGHGKPLDLSVNPYEGDQALAFRMLKDNDVLPVWIAERQELMDEIKVWRKKIAEQWEMVRPQLDTLLTNDDPATHRRRLIAITMQWENQITAFNKKIDKCNVVIPIPHLRLLTMTLPAEKTRVGATFEP